MFSVLTHRRSSTAFVYMVVFQLNSVWLNFPQFATTCSGRESFGISATCQMTILSLKCLSTEENHSKQLPQSEKIVHWPHPCLVCYLVNICCILSESLSEAPRSESVCSYPVWCQMGSPEIHYILLIIIISNLRLVFS